jgi:hypothetical protein
MTFRPWMVAALSLGTLTAWTSAPPATHRYKLDVKTTQVVNLAALGQGEQRIEITASGFVTVSSVDSAGGQAVKVVLDSLNMAEGSPIPPEAAKSAAGATWVPPFTAGTPAGKTWTDTNETTRNGGVAIRTVTNFQTSADSYNGQKVTKLAGASASSVSGSQESPQGTVQIDGTGNATSSWLVTADGTCVSSTYSGTQALRVTVAVAPEPLPLSVTTEGTASLLK